MSNVQNFNDLFLKYIFSSVSVVVGLAWNDFFSNVFKKIIPFKKDGSMKSKFIYALLLTLIVITIMYFVVPKIPLLNRNIKI